MWVSCYSILYIALCTLFPDDGYFNLLDTLPPPLPPDHFPFCLDSSFLQLEFQSQYFCFIDEVFSKILWTQCRIHNQLMEACAMVEAHRLVNCNIRPHRHRHCHHHHRHCHLRRQIFILLMPFDSFIDSPLDSPLDWLCQSSKQTMLYTRLNQSRAGQDQ